MIFIDVLSKFVPVYKIQFSLINQDIVRDKVAFFTRFFYLTLIHLFFSLSANVDQFNMNILKEPILEVENKNNGKKKNLLSFLFTGPLFYTGHAFFGNFKHLILDFLLHIVVWWYFRSGECHSDPSSLTQTLILQQPQCL